MLGKTMNDLDLYNETNISTETADYSHLPTSHLMNALNHDCVSRFEVKLSPTSVDNEYSVEFTFEQYKNNAEQDLLKLIVGEFGVNFDPEHHKLSLIDGDTSVILEEDMINSCLSCIKVVQKDHSAE
ncbi:conserved hypothetical protein [Ehrlichia chaffeensis str. Arkansas]|uniref:Uncharacterized protein n=3 Tax=Ehrlichia chaffeensis TaxID=945 RepID=Q2GF52_EHRCR|nr:unknown function UN4 [Ehrlichia chaffeensis]ABD45427.1 conserved hypothetical protein [Ehrlichia chaffeensis str. Arkansas]AHX07790.1 hypothetical protein ECHOSC_0040 [Ehrlichia chaffeensis str. Osceola]